MSVMCLSESIIKIFVNSNKCLFIKKFKRVIAICDFDIWKPNNLLYLVSLNFMFYRK